MKPEKCACLQFRCHRANFSPLHHPIKACGQKLKEKKLPGGSEMDNFLYAELSYLFAFFSNAKIVVTIPFTRNVRPNKFCDF